MTQAKMRLLKSATSKEEKIYERLMQLIPTDFTWHTKLTSEGYMDLSIEWLWANKEKGYYDISLTHYYEQNGDLMRDPDMTVRIWDNGRAEALTFQQDWMFAVYHEVYAYNEDGTVRWVRLMLKNELNKFLLQWLKNLEEQGFYTFKKWHASTKSKV